MDMSHTLSPHADPKSVPETFPPALPRLTMQNRALAGAIALSALSVLVLAAWLKPASAGYGTHEQLGMFPCTWAAVLNKPCPTCGMTTAFANAANGDLLASFTSQPFGALLAVVAASIFWAGLHIAVTGSHLGRMYSVLLRNRSIWIAGGLLLAAWVYKLVTWPGYSG